MYANLRTWYSKAELSQYEQFLAITDKHIIKKSIDVATGRVTSGGITGVSFLSNMEGWPGRNLQVSSASATGSAIHTEKDVQTMEVSALARIQKRKMSRNYFSLILSFMGSNEPPLQGSRNLATYASIMAKAADLDDVVTVLRSINPFFVVEDWSYQC